MTQEPPCTGPKVLVAEDTPVSQKLMKALLSAFGCVVDVAANGREAVEKVRENDYDLVLMDLMMPVMDGLEATKAIRRAGRTDLPIIALTAAVTEEDKQRTRDAGSNDFLAKPVDPKQLKETIAKWGRVARPAPLTGRTRNGVEHTGSVGGAPNLGTALR